MRGDEVNGRRRERWEQIWNGNLKILHDDLDGDDLMTTLMKMVTTMIAPSMYVIVNQCSLVSGVWKTGDDRNFQPKEPPADSLTICAIFFQKRVSSKIFSQFQH